MAPCEKSSYKVGDKFEVVNPRRELKKGDIVELSHDDGSDIPVFIGDRVSGQIHLELERVKPLPKLTKSKQWLADAIHNHGAGWPDGAKWACQDGDAGILNFTRCEKPTRLGEKGWQVHDAGFMSRCVIHGHKPQPNWHQTVLSRDEYFSVYPEVSDSSESETTSQPDTLDTLMKRWEDAKVSVQQAHDAVAAELERRGWNEPAVLDITDWRDLKVGDVIHVLERYSERGEFEVLCVDEDGVMVQCINDGQRYWPKCIVNWNEFEFIRRP